MNWTKSCTCPDPVVSLGKNCLVYGYCLVKIAPVGRARPQIVSIVMRKCCLVATVAASLTLAFGEGSAGAADLVWEVVNPFRLYRQSKSFALHQAAYGALRPVAGEPPADLIQRIERCLNDPDPAQPAAFAICRGLAQTLNFDRQLGWASSTVEDTCYDRSARPRAYPATCAREGRAEDLVLPASHVVRIGLSPSRLAQAGIGDCAWSWMPRAGGQAQTARLPCAQGLLISDVPFAREQAASGVEVEARLPDGRTVSESVVVDDVFVVALGDSFASGEGNPDRPVRLSNARALDYTASSSRSADRRLKGARKDDFFSYYLPKRVMRDEEIGRIYPFDSQEFLDAFWERSAVWLSPDCHRSQYAFPFRVALQLALEDRHRAVTLVNLGCSGAEVIKGLFEAMPAREHWDASRAKTRDVPGQFEQLTRLLCRTNARGTARYPLKEFAPGSTRGSERSIALSYCPKEDRKRDIDLILLSIGGNDVGFSQLAAYTFLESVGDIARIARVREHQLRFGPNVANAYLSVLDARLDAVRKALDTGFGVAPAKVVHVSYEPALNDENQDLCGRDPDRARTGMDVHARFRFDAGRVREVNGFLNSLLGRLQCIAQGGPSCGGSPPAGGGTGFALVVEHQNEFLRRGVCARDPGANANLMQVPRIRIGATGFSPYLPGAYRPYAHHRRLFRTPNDGFMTANEHKGGETPLIDIVQPAIAALYSGAFHPTAEAHALVADHAMPHVRRVLGAGKVVADAPRELNTMTPAQ